MISLRKDNFEKLQAIDNVSGLINNLLDDYFKNSEDPKEKLKMINLEIERKSLESEQIKNKLQEIELRKEEFINRKLSEEEKEEEQNKKWDRIRLLQHEAFKSYIVKEEEREFIFEEFFLLLKEGKVKNLIEFCLNKNIQRKQNKRENAE